MYEKIYRMKQAFSFIGFNLFLQTSLAETSEKEGESSVIKALSPSQQGDAWKCSC